MPSSRDGNTPPFPFPLRPGDRETNIGRLQRKGDGNARPRLGARRLATGDETGMMVMRGGVRGGRSRGSKVGRSGVAKVGGRGRAGVGFSWGRAPHIAHRSRGALEKVRASNPRQRGQKGRGIGDGSAQLGKEEEEPLRQSQTLAVSSVPIGKEQQPSQGFFKEDPIKCAFYFLQTSPQITINAFPWPIRQSSNVSA